MKKTNSTAETKKRTGQINVLDMVYIAMATAILTVCAQIQIPTAIPFTLQTLGVFITASLLGIRKGTLSVVIYILLGLIGVPVFAGFTGGFGTLFGMTGGYIIGFIFTALAIGLITKIFGKGIVSLSIAMVVGLILCYLFGTVWFMVVYGNSYGAVTFISALQMCVIPYLPFDIAKIVVSVITVKLVLKYVKF